LSPARTTAALRTTASIALGALIVHQLRYLIGYGDGAGAALAAQGHTYLTAALLPVTVLAVSSLFATVAAGVMFASDGAARRSAGWAFCATALIVVFGVQESVEGVLAAGHPGGLGAAFGHGGWIAVPIAVAIGGIVSLVLAALGLVDRKLTSVRPRQARRAPAALGRPMAPKARLLTRAPLAFGLARRPPPLLSV
jgi:hypothetical protein